MLWEKMVNSEMTAPFFKNFFSAQVDSAKQGFVSSSFFFLSLHTQPSDLLPFNPRNSHSLLFLHGERCVNLVDSRSGGRNTDRAVDMPAAGRRTAAGAAAPWTRRADSHAVRHSDIQAAGRWSWTARRSSVL